MSGHVLRKKDPVTPWQVRTVMIPEPLPWRDLWPVTQVTVYRKDNTQASGGYDKCILFYSN